METKNVFNETVNTLVEDANSLTKQYNGWVKHGEHKKAIDTLRLLKDTLSLIKEYDWHLEYSEYETDNQKQIAIWEQNHCGDIRNHKIWNISDTTNVIKNTWENLFKVFIENKQSILYELSYDKEKEHRGTGKSTAIEKLAVEYDLPIVTSRYRAREYNETLYKSALYLSKTSRAFYSFDDFLQSNFAKSGQIVLVDEALRNEDYKKLIEKNDYDFILIGFAQKN